jgi:hypothetical protein
MIPVPTIHGWKNGERPNFRDMNNYLENPLSFLLNPPMVRLRKTTAQSIPNTTSTALIWDYVEVETVNFWDATAPTKLTPSVPGWYIGTAGFSFANNATGIRAMNVIKNGSVTERVITVSHDAYTDSGITVVSRGNIFFESFNGTTDYITIEVQQTSGGALSLLNDVIERQPDVSLRWLSAL